MAPIQTKHYAYKELGNKDINLDDDFQPQGSFAIRIIELDPAEHTVEDLHCRIEHIELSENPKYDAISYVWGEPVFSKTLYCDDGAVLSITPTLDTALRRFRDNKEKKRLWADAVCINQKDKKELSQQVQHMSLIYTTAHSVLVWLGDGPEMDKCVNFLWGLSSSRHEASVTADRADASVKEELNRFFGSTRFDAVQRLFALPWFQRRWVVQEAAHGAHFYCGSIDITSHALHHAMYVLNRSSFPFDRGVLDHIGSLEAYAEIQEASMSAPDGDQQRNGQGILDLLVRFSDPVCTDDRDRIYAYLGLADDVRSPYANVSTEEDRLAIRDFAWKSKLGTLNAMTRGLNDLETTSPPDRISARIPVQVDYTVDADLMYADFAEQMLQHKPNLDILHCSGAFRPPLTSALGPRQTWIPDWRLPMRHRPFLSVPWFRAGGSETKDEPFLNYPWCSVKGIIFDTVSVACKIPGLDTRHARDTRAMPPVARLCNALCMSGKYVTGERVWQVLGLTFIADHALNYGLRELYHSKDVFGYTGKRVKRNASERDMHAFLDWWVERPESGLKVGALQRDGSKPRKKKPSNSVPQALFRPHLKSLHRSEMIGCFLKPSETAGEWGPTSYEQQSHTHTRIPDEMERYFLTDIRKMESNDNTQNTESDPRQNKQLSDAPSAKKGVAKWRRARRARRDNETPAQGPDDEPYDCDWRLQEEKWVSFNPHERNSDRYAELCHNTLRGRSLFVTSRGFIGIGPDDIDKGDTVVILYGARTPFILRTTEKSGYWRLAGDCYIHGIMNGEAVGMGLGPDRQFVFI